MTLNPTAYKTTTASDRNRISIDLIQTGNGPDVAENFDMPSNRNLSFNLKIANLHRAIASSPRLFRT